MPFSALLLTGVALFELLPVEPTGDRHVRTWNIRGDDWVAGVMAYPTADPSRLLVHSWVGLDAVSDGSRYLSDWTPVSHAPLAWEAAAASIDGSRIVTGKREHDGGGTVEVIDTASGESLFAVPSARFSTGGSALWPWLSTDGAAAAFTISSGAAPTAPAGLVAPVDGVVVWEEGSNGVRVLADPGATVRGASDDLHVLVVRNPTGRVVAYDRAGAELHELCALWISGEETCGFRGLSPDGRYASVVDEGVMPHRRGLVDLSTGIEEPLPSRGTGSSWVAFDQDSARMLYSRAGAQHDEMVVRYMADGREVVLDIGPNPESRRPLGFVAGRYAVMGGWDTTFVDTEVISADGFDATTSQ